MSEPTKSQLQGAWIREKQREVLFFYMGIGFIVYLILYALLDFFNLAALRNYAMFLILGIMFYGGYKAIKYKPQVE